MYTIRSSSKYGLLQRGSYGSRYIISMCAARGSKFTPNDQSRGLRVRYHSPAEDGSLGMHKI